MAEKFNRKATRTQRAEASDSKLVCSAPSYKQPSVSLQLAILLKSFPACVLHHFSAQEEHIGKCSPPFLANEGYTLAYN